MDGRFAAAGNAAADDGAPVATETVPALLGLADPAPFELVNPFATTPLLLVCDHAGRAFPAALGRLGLDEGASDRHIAWDIGAAALTRALARRLDAPAVLATYSRLVIDVNRQPGDPQSIVAVSDGTPIPGNETMSEADEIARAEAIHWPYHHAVDQAFARLRRIGPEPLFISIHTFTPCLATPCLADAPRPWDIGILWNHDPRVAVPLLALLRRHAGLRVGDNEPYSARELAYTLNLHAGAAGLPHAAIEVRQDHCASERAIARWAEMLGDALSTILRMPHLHRIAEF
jgi:Predicted N-formylglutamate amidohydrolase